MKCSRPTCCHKDEDQPLTNFCKSKQSKSGFHPWCNDCRKEYNILRKDKIKEYNKKYKTENKDKMIEYDKNRRENKREIVNEFSRKWHSKFAKYDTFHNQIEAYEEIKRDENNIELLQVKCAYCGSWFNPTNSQIQNRIYSISGIKSGEAKLYCCKQCKTVCPVYRQKEYYKFQDQNSSREVQPELRKLVLERDNYTCQKCNTHKDDLDVGLHCHHIDPVINNPIESADMDNCITLCKTCHNLVHQKDGCGYGQLKC